MTQKTGYVALLGCPNAGKSTLLNACMGTKIAIVSNKPQTTRNKILGICTKGDTQILFLDTPGMHKTQHLPSINKLMNKTAWSVLPDLDLLCYLVDVTRGLTAEDLQFLSDIFKKFRKKVILLATKIDKIKKDVVREKMTEINNRFQAFFTELNPEEIHCKLVENSFLPFSAKTPESVEAFQTLISGHLEEGPWLYGKDDLTDKSQKFICAEMIREQIFRQLGSELPYKIAVTVDLFETKAKITNISATITVERPSQKAIVIGKGGLRLKNIGTLSRESLERFLDRKVFLELFVKVQNGWTDNLNMITQLANLENISYDLTNV